MSELPVDYYTSNMHGITKIYNFLISITLQIILFYQFYIFDLCLHGAELRNFNSLPNSIHVMKPERNVGRREIRSISKYHQGSHKTRDTEM
jgi:hypothetical protein